MSFIQRVLSPVVQVRRDELLTVLLMFAYSFLAMTVWNTIKPLTRSQFIRDLGADNLPYVLLVSGLVIGILMAGYVWLMARLPRKWGLPIVQAAMGGLLVVFWFLFEGYLEPELRTGTVWVSVVFYLVGMIFGLLLISQFWTVANLVYDPRQAKRLFGFIGGGAPLGGFAGSALAAWGAIRLGSVTLLLPSAALMLASAAVTAWIITRERIVTGEAIKDAAGQEKGVSAGEAFRLLRESSHLKIIALVISFASIGAAIIEQQLNMAAQAVHGREAEDSITAFLAIVGMWMSGIGFIIQIWLTSKIHRYLGIGFALMILPVSLGATAIVMLFNAALWAPALARLLDQSLRYTVDKTTREILFLPLPDDIKLQAKSFVDVTVDRVARAAGALMLIVLVQPWGLNLDWQRISYASLAMVGLWIAMAVYARRGYLKAFRQSIERRDLAPSEVRLSGADLSTIETLVQELANPDASRVVYAIDVLESLDKRNLVTPLLLYHESPEVRERALRTLGGVQGPKAAEWLPQIRRLLDDDVPSVRAAAIRAVGAIGNEDAMALARPMTGDRNSRIRATAAVVLAGSESPGDLMLAEATLLDLCADTGEQGRHARRDVAAAIRGIDNPRFRRLLIPLLYDPDPAVAGTAMRSVQEAGTADFLFVPTLVALLRQRQLKGRARDVLVSYGEAVIDPLAHFLRDRDEDIWVRRHIPATLARIPSQRSVDVLVEALGDPDGFLRFKAIAGLERLRHSDAPLTFPRGPVEKQAVREANRFFTYLSLHDNLFRRGGLPADSLLGQALEQKMDRARRRIYRLLSLIYPWKDIVAVQWTMTRGDAKTRASASEYLDNVLTGELRRRVMPLIEDLPIDEKVRRSNVLVKTRPRDVEETLLQLINDEDQVVAASAIDLVRQAKLWALGDDVEHVLAHRDARDWYVFEAASWALAERRMPAERRRELWLEPLPAAELAGRLRALAMFAFTSVEELFRLAGNSRQVRHEQGEVLAQAGSTPEAVHLLLDGAAITQTDGTPRTIEAPAALGLIEALQGQPMREGLRAGPRAVTLALSADDLRTLLAENTDLVAGLFATLADHASGAGLGLVQPASTPPRDVERGPGEAVRPVEKVLALERAALFARLSPDEAAQLSEITRTVPLTAGAPLFAESATPAIWIVLSGEIALTGPDGAGTIVRPGDVLGALATLAGRPLGHAATVAREGVALRIDREDLFELLGERPALLRQLFAGMFRMTGSQVELTSGVR
jgi:ATP:ADP antiporter, AAA family